MVRAMIRQIAPQFFTTDLPATLTYYKEKLGFDCVGAWQDPPVYAIVARDDHRIHFRCAEPPAPNSEKYDDELLDAYDARSNDASIRRAPLRRGGMTRCRVRRTGRDRLPFCGIVIVHLIVAPGRSDWATTAGFSARANHRSSDASLPNCLREAIRACAVD
jgi:hypothetical protein